MIQTPSGVFYFEKICNNPQDLTVIYMKDKNSRREQIWKITKLLNYSFEEISRQ